jgi:hypothetical protein
VIELDKEIDSFNRNQEVVRKLKHECDTEMREFKKEEKEFET